MLPPSRGIRPYAKSGVVQFPETKAQRCWFHKAANVHAALPKSAHPAAVRATQDIYDADDGDLARVAAKAFAIDCGAKFPRAVAKIIDDLDVLLEFYNFPAEHWVHLRTTNPIESTFATVPHRTKVTKGPGSRAAGLAMAFKLIEAAQARWRAVNAPQLVALVRAGSMFRQGKLVERPADDAEAQVALKICIIGLDYCSSNERPPIRPRSHRACQTRCTRAWI